MLPVPRGLTHGSLHASRNREHPRPGDNPIFCYKEYVVSKSTTCQAKLESSLTSCQSPMDPLLIQPRRDDKTGNNGTYCIDSNDRWLQTLPRHSEMVVPQDQAYGQRPHKNFKSFETLEDGFRKDYRTKPHESNTWSQGGGEYYCGTSSVAARRDPSQPKDGATARQQPLNMAQFTRRIPFRVRWNETTAAKDAS